MEIKDIIAKLEIRIKNQETGYVQYEEHAYEFLKHLKQLDPNLTVKWGGDVTHTGDHYPVDKEGNIHFDQKKFFHEGEAFPDDDYAWIAAS